MISPGYILAQFGGVIAMARNAPDWRHRLDTDTDGFFRSFWAVPLTLPLVVVSLVLADNSQIVLATGEPVEAPIMPFTLLAILQVMVSVLSWGAVVIVLMMVARGMKASDRVSPLIVGYNWSELLKQLLMTFLLFLVLAGPVPQVMAGLLLGGFIFVIYLRWGVVRRALDCNVVQAIAILGMMFLIPLLIALIVVGTGTSLYELLSGPGDAPATAMMRVVPAD